MLKRLKNQSLFREEGLIDGSWSTSDSKQTLLVQNPATGEKLGTIPNMGAQETRRAILAAKNAWRGWREKTARERGVILRRWYELVLEHQDDLATIMTLEQGRPYKDAKNEVIYAATFIDWYAEEGKRIYGDVIPQPQRDSRTIVLKEPIGVCGAITPWNMPSAMVTRKAATALAAGCTVVLKPAEQTPYSAIALAVLAQEAGLPNGVLNLVTGDPEPIGIELTTNRIVRKITFTGSTEVGKILMRQSSDSIKKVSFELGGNSPFIVFDDADIDAAVQGAMASKFRNTGQTCVCVNRFFVQEAVYEEFTSKLATAVRALQVGDGSQAGMTQGPLINAAAFVKVQRHVNDALAKGAHALCGAKGSVLGGTFYEPTVLVNAHVDMDMAHEETFGPVAACYKFNSEDEVIQLANNTDYGLSAYFYSRDLARVWHVAEQLQAGIVGINEGIISTEIAPFGGVKESGVGREGSRYGLADYMEIKYLLMGGLRHSN